MQEIEIKFKIKDLTSEQIKTILSGYNINFGSTITQIDTVYCHKDAVLMTSLKEEDKKSMVVTKGEKVMRIRQETKLIDGLEVTKNILTMKVQLDKALENLEYETIVQDPDQMAQMLIQFGYNPIAIVNKQRAKAKTFVKLDNQDKPVSVCLDDVEHLGCFVELEVLLDDELSKEGVQDKLEALLNSLGLQGEVVNIPYDTQVRLRNV
jgi:predicted adenylyl cyclase CyaB